MIAEARSSVVEVVWEEKIKIAEDIKNAGSWDMTGWHEALAKVTGRPINIFQDPRRIEREKKKKRRRRRRTRRRRRE